MPFVDLKLCEFRQLTSLARRRFGKHLLNPRSQVGGGGPPCDLYSAKTRTVGPRNGADLRSAAAPATGRRTQNAAKIGRIWTRLNARAKPEGRLFRASSWRR